MSEVLIRQWGPGTYAVYLELGDRYPTFVGIEPTTEMAHAHAQSVIADPVECSKRRWCETTSDGESGQSERVFGGEWSEQRDGPRNSTTPARLAPEPPGATQ